MQLQQMARRSNASFKTEWWFPSFIVFYVALKQIKSEFYTNFVFDGVKFYYNRRNRTESHKIWLKETNRSTFSTNGAT